MATEHENQPDADLLTPVQARHLLGVSLRTYQRYIADGTLVEDARTPKGHRRFRRATVEQLQQVPDEAVAP